MTPLPESTGPRGRILESSTTARGIEVVTMADVTPVVFVVDDECRCANRWSC